MNTNYYIKKNQEKTYDKPNEDYLIADQGRNFFIVSDGVTRELDNGIYPFPSPATATSKLLCSYMHENWGNGVLDFNDFKEKIRKNFLAANELIKNYNEDIDKGMSGFEAGTVAVVSTIVNSKLMLAYVGDCSCAVIREQKFIQLTRPQTTLVVANRALFSRYEVRRNICNNPNHPYGFGVFNGDPRVENFLVFLQEELESGDTIFLYSDGCDPVMSQDFVYFLETASVEEIILKTEQLDLVSRNRSDDKSLIKIQI